MLKHCRTLFVLGALALVAVNLSAQSLTSELGAESNSSSKFEVLQHSPVAFWHGMSRAQFEQRTQPGPAGGRVLALGQWVFTVATADFADDDTLERLSLEYRNDSKQAVHDAFDAYKRALGGITPDLQHTSSGTPEVPDLDFEMQTWKNDSGSESALVRLHSVMAAKKLAGTLPAGLAAFVVKAGVSSE